MSSDWKTLNEVDVNLPDAERRAEAERKWWAELATQDELNARAKYWLTHHAIRPRINVKDFVRDAHDSDHEFDKVSLRIDFRQPDEDLVESFREWLTDTRRYHTHRNQADAKATRGGRPKDYISDLTDLAIYRLVKAHGGVKPARAFAVKEGKQLRANEGQWYRSKAYIEEVIDGLNAGRDIIRDLDIERDFGLMDLLEVGPL